MPTAMLAALLLAAASIPAPANGIYLGAWVNPDAPGPAPAKVVEMTQSFESNMASVSGVHRVLALHLHFYGWDKITRVTTDPSIADDFAKGRTPVLTWTCGNSLTNIARGEDDDAYIVAAARAIASLHKPVMLRWFHEFNFNLTQGRANGQAEICFDAYSPSQRLADNVPGESREFIAAWRHIHDVFVREGATNVTWLWCPSGAENQVKRLNLMSFFPGPAFVDWIGGDFYDRKQEGFARAAQPFYNMAHSNYPNIPIIIVETGEEAGNTGSASQAQFFSDMAADLPTLLPQIKAVMYFDARGAESGHSWILNTEGFNAFAKMAANPYFAPIP